MVCSASKMSWRAWLRRSILLCLLLCGGPALAAPTLWTVSDGQGQVRAYLFGTIHLCDPACFPFPEKVNRSFDRADRLVLELDATDPDVVATVMSAGMLPPGQSLTAQMADPLAGDMARAASAVGIPLEALVRMQPWFASTVMIGAAAAKAGYSPNEGIDMALQSLAKFKGKPVVSLETAERQIEAMGAGGEAAQMAALRQTVDMINEGAAKEYFDSMVTAWRDGDDESLLRLMYEGVETQAVEPLMAELMVSRNHEMAARIDALLGEPGRLFVAVGGGHLVGEQNIPGLLARRGWQVRRVNQ